MVKFFQGIVTDIGTLLATHAALFFLTIAVVAAVGTAREIFTRAAAQLHYVAVLGRWNADRAWWVDARFSVIPAEQHLAVEVLADVYGIETRS